ncbi:MAG: hypothetical protein E7207_08665 [Clostridium butyricum]|nr:hypothetical protein [Clostridium butyricum]
MKFPDSVPVLYVLSEENCESDENWEKYHRDIVTNSNSRVTVIEGDHYLHWSNLNTLTKEIEDWQKTK